MSRLGSVISSKMSLYVPRKFKKDEPCKAKVSIRTDCLSFEMMKNSKESIAEFLIIGFLFNLDAFADINRVKLRLAAQTLLVLHSDDQRQFFLKRHKMTKKVMCGHVGCRGSIVYDEHIYWSLPAEVKRWTKKADSKLKNQLDVKVDIFPMQEGSKKHGKGGDIKLNVNIKELKFYLRPKVLTDIAVFFIGAARKMDQAKRIFHSP
jgi:hypothetical protein